MDGVSLLMCKCEAADVHMQAAGEQSGGVGRGRWRRPVDAVPSPCTASSHWSWMRRAPGAIKLPNNQPVEWGGYPRPIESLLNNRSTER